MRIGLTYDLRSAYLAQGHGELATAEFDRDDTIDAVEGALQELGHDPVRIGSIRELAPRLVAGERWDLVFNFAEGLTGFGRESQVPALLEAYDIPYTFSDPLVLALTLHKGVAKRLLRDAGLPTPDFAVVDVPADVKRVALPFPLFVKPVAEGTGKGVDALSRVEDAVELEARCKELLARFRQPVLVESYLPGRELTVGVLGTGSRARVIGTLEATLLDGAEAGAYTYTNKERCEELVRYSLATDDVAQEAEAVALAAYRSLGCRDAGRVDLRLDVEGRPSLMELNPIAGLHPEHSDLPMLCAATGLSYLQLVAEILESATDRIRGEGQ